LLSVSTALLLASPAAAVPFDLFVFQDGVQIGTYSQATNWLTCSESGNTTTCGSDVNRVVGGLTLDSWSLFFDNDPIVLGNVAVINSAGVTAQFTLIFSLPVSSPLGPTTVTSGSVTGGVTDGTVNGIGATLSAPTGSSLYSALIDGNLVTPFQTLYDAPYSLTSPSLGSASLPAADFGIPNPPGLPGPTVNSSIGIRLDFTLTPGDSASFTSNFVVEVPEPTTGVLIGLGLLGVAAVSRRRTA